MRVLVATSDGVWLARPGQAPEQLGLAGTSCRSVAAIEGVYYAGTARDGLWRSLDEGRTWGSAGLEGQEILTIAAPAGTSDVHVAGRPVEVYRSEAGKGVWEGLNLMSAPNSDTWLLPIRGGTRVLAVSFDAADPLLMYTAVEVGGAIVSDDGGATWRTEVPGGDHDVHRVVAHPAKPEHVFCSTGFTRLGGDEGYYLIEKGGVYRSADRGRTWEWMWSEEWPPYTLSLVMDPWPPHPLFVVAAPEPFASIRQDQGARTEIRMSIDEGKTWTSIGDADHSPSPAFFTGIAVDPERPGGLIACTENGEVWRIDAASRRWEPLATGLGYAQGVAPV
ncbi:MAG TPA: sialidase family protein [Dehalococcoidia bacterium]|nr:sialidase family protein [Dehalococcoidia bacterium]